MSDRSASSRSSSGERGRSREAKPAGSGRTSRRSSKSSRSSSKSSRSSRSHSDDRQQKKSDTKGRQNGNSRSGNGANSRSYTTSRGSGAMGRPSNLTRRVLSAGRMRLNELRNRVAELSSSVVSLQEENRLMRRQQFRQEKKIQQYESMENDMPTLLQRQMGEMNMLREQLRRHKERLSGKEKKLKDTEEDLERSKRLLRKMKGLVDDKQLGERDKLSRELEKASRDLEEKEKQIKTLERHVENLNKNHKHEFGIERARQKESTKMIDDLKEELNGLQAQLKERERELQMKSAAQVNRSNTTSTNHINTVKKSHSDDLYLTNKTQHKKAGTSPYSDASHLNGHSPRGDVSGFDDEYRAAAAKNEAKQRYAELNRKNASEAAARSKRERDERQRREREEEARRQAEETRRKTEEDDRLQRVREEERRRQREKQEEEERRTREESRVKREQEDETRRRTEEAERIRAAEEAKKFDQSEEGRAQKRQKEALLAKLNNGGDARDSKASKTNGTGRRNSKTTSRRQAAEDDPVFGEYKPSFLAANGSKQSGQQGGAGKSSFIDDLFGGDGDKRVESPAIAEFNFEAGRQNTTTGSGRVLPRRVRQSATTIPQSGDNKAEVVEDFLL